MRRGPYRRHCEGTVARESCVTRIPVERARRPGRRKPGRPSSVPKRRPHTITDVADRAGVAIKTVSRVLNREPSVRPETLHRVQQAIRELNYRPNPSARNLASAREHLIAILYNNPSANYVVSVLEGVLAACEAEHHGVLLQPCETGGARLIDQIHDLLNQRRARGLVLTPPLCDDRALLDMLDAEQIDYASIAPGDEQRGRPFVAIDDEKASRDLTEYLISRAHRRIGFIKGHPLHGAAAKRLLGYQAALREHGIPPDESLIASGNFSFESGVECARRLLSLRHAPSAIFAANDDMAAGVMHAAYENGLEIPRELSVVGFDDSPTARYVYPTLTTVRQPVRAMAHAAVDCLMRSIRQRSGRGDATPVSQRFDYDLVIRDSVSVAKTGA